MKRLSRKSSLKLLSLIFALLAFPTKSQGLIAVVDKTAIAQAIQQVSEMKQQYEVMRKQYDELVSLNTSLTGSYGVGGLLNSLEDQQSRRPLPKTWQEVVAGQAQGFYGERLDHYAKLFPEIDTRLMASYSASEQQSYTLGKQSTAAAFAATEAVYNQIEQRIETIESLVKEIDQTPNVKAAMNLNSRIVAETGFISLDLARLNSMQLNLSAQMQNRANQSWESHTRFFTKP